MNTLPPSYAFATSPCQQFSNHGTITFTFAANGVNADGPTCLDAQLNWARKTGKGLPNATTPKTTTTVPPKTATSPKTSGRKKQVHTPAAPGSLGTGSVIDASPAPTNSIIDTIKDSVSSVSDTISSATGLPSDFNGIPLPVILVGAAAVLIILFTMM